MPKTGGALQVIDDGVVAPISFDGPSLVYTRITSHPQSGGDSFDYPNVVLLGDRCSSDALPSGGPISEVFLPTVDGAGGVSWIGYASWSSDEASILHWNSSTNTTSRIAEFSTEPAAIVGDADHLYWTETSTSGTTTVTSTTTITTIPSAGGTPSTLATLSGDLMIAAIDDDSLYLGSPPGFQPPSAPGLPPVGPVPGLTRVSKADGSITNTIVTPPAATGFVAHDTNVYWVGATSGDPSTGPTVQRAPKNGGPSEVVLDLGGGNGTVLSLAFDSCNIYVNAAESGPSGGYAIWGQGLSSAAAASGNPVDASAPTEDASTPSDASLCPEDAAPAEESVHAGSPRRRGR
jgi:hypothetical protein